MTHSIQQNSSFRPSRLLRSITLMLSLVLLVAPVAVLRAQSTIVSGADPVPSGEPDAMPMMSLAALMILGMA